MQDKRKLQEEITQKRRKVEEEKLKHQHLKVSCWSYITKDSLKLFNLHKGFGFWNANLHAFKSRFYCQIFTAFWSLARTPFDFNKHHALKKKKNHTQKLMLFDHFHGIK